MTMFEPNTSEEVRYNEKKKIAIEEAESYGYAGEKRRRFVIGELAVWSKGLKFLFRDEELNLTDDEKNSVIKRVSKVIKGELAIDTQESAEEYVRSILD